MAMHFSTFLRSAPTAAVSSKFVNQTSRRMTFAARGPESLSTRRMPVIMWAGSMVAPIIPRTRLFQYSSTWPPPMLGLSWYWKCPPLAFILSSHSGRMFSRKIMMASMTWRPSGCSRTIRLFSRSSLGWGMWFHSFQKLCTDEQEATLWVASEYCADLAFDCSCSHTAQVYARGKSFFNSSSVSSEPSVVNLRPELKFSLKLRYAIVFKPSET
mmetsp:Transcript_80722/g.210564  ORF Transcript_80722/g.210564 Transcript_80722/m.210564 type:complete len:213 (+) Transcript_80722:333-971(+)